jgi:protease-4
VPEAAAAPPPPPPAPPAAPPLGASALPPPLPPRPAISPNPSPAASRSTTGRGWKIATLILALVLAFSLLSNFAGLLLGLFAGGSGGPLGMEGRLQEITVEHNRSANKIAVIPIEGIITSSAADGGGYSLPHLVEDQLKLAGKDDSVKAVILKVNSPGGEVLASDDIYAAIAQFQNEHKKPVVASMGSLAASGGYYVSAPCRWIVANELTITGSIGVIMHGYNYRGLMNKVGVRPLVFKSGRFKDMLSGEKDLDSLTPAEKEDLEEENGMVNKMINETFERFKKVVADGRKAAYNRNANNKDKEIGQGLSSNWAKLADGRVLSGKEAYDNGFVDELGNWRTAVKRAQKLAGIDKADLVTYQVPFSLGNLLGLLGKSDAKSVKVDVGLDIPRLGAGFYYLAPAFLR